MPTRPSLEDIPLSSTSSRMVHHRPVEELYHLLARMTFHIIPSKLEDELDDLYEMIKDMGGSCVRPSQARFILTALQGRPRIEKAVGREMASSKVVLGIEYLHEVFRRVVEAATEGAIPHLPDREGYLRLCPSLKRSIDAEPPRKRQRVGGDEGKDGIIAIDLPDLSPVDPDIKFEDIPRYAVQRACPLVCINQDIIDAIKPIYDEREYEESHQKNSNVLSYRRSMSVSLSYLGNTDEQILKSAPRRIKSGKEARKLQDLGEKVAQRIDEFLERGHIAESEEIIASPRYQALRLFASVYTIGHHTAKDLYDRHHCRTLEDVRQHYANISDESEEVRLKVKERRRKEGGMLHVDIVEEWMKIKDDLDAKIPREEVEEIAACVMEHVSAFIPGCQHTICGGYRRGKSMSNDVDVVFCPPDPDADIGLLRDVYLRLSELGLITHVLHVTHRDSIAPIRASPNNFDNLDKAFVVFKLPGNGRKHRRVDLISAPKERYAAAVLSWSGSMMFERDLRRYAEHRGYKFRAGLRVPTTGEEINFDTEREIFHFLGLPYVPPELRNADG